MIMDLLVQHARIPNATAAAAPVAAPTATDTQAGDAALDPAKPMERDTGPCRHLQRDTGVGLVHRHGQRPPARVLHRQILPDTLQLLARVLVVVQRAPLLESGPR
jgi:hypothetical protein